MVYIGFFFWGWFIVGIGWCCCFVIGCRFGLGGCVVFWCWECGVR